MNLLIIRFQQLSLSDEALLQQDAGTITENAGYGISRYDELFRRSEPEVTNDPAHHVRRIHGGSRGHDLYRSTADS